MSTGRSRRGGTFSGRKEKGNRPARSRRLALERLEDRTLLDGLPLVPGVLPAGSGDGSGSGWIGSGVSGGAMLGPLTLAPQPAGPYTPPDGTEAWVDGTTVRYRVYDPNLGQWVLGQTAYASTLSIMELTNSDGVVAWTVGYPNGTGGHTARVVGFAVYDSTAGEWKQAAGGSASVYSIADLLNRDGVVGWTIGYADGSTGGYVAREVGGAVYDATLAAWQKFQTSTSGGARTIVEIVNQDGVLAWTVGLSGGTAGTAAAFATYDYTLQGWRQSQTANNSGISVFGIQTADGTVAWKAGYTVLPAGLGSVAGEVGWAAYDTALGQWQYSQTSTGDVRQIVDLTLSGGVAAWTIGYPSTVFGDFAITDGTLSLGDASPLELIESFSSAVPRDVGYVTYDAALRQWRTFQTANPAASVVANLVNQDGVVAWTVGHSDDVAGLSTPRAVAAATYDPGRAAWKQFQSAESGAASVIELQTAGGLVAWRIGYTSLASGTTARNVGLAAYDYALGQWLLAQTANDVTTNVSQLVTSGGVAAWSTGKAVYAEQYDRALRSWSAYSTSLAGDAVVVSLATRYGLVGWTVGYPTGPGGAIVPRDVGYAIYDVDSQSWQECSDVYALGEVIDSFAIEDAAVRYSVDGTPYRRSYDPFGHAWTDDFSVPRSQFVAAPTGGVAPASFRFSDMSMEATRYAWDFGDGASAATASATHSYRQAGLYTVTQTVYSPGGSHSSSVDVAVAPVGVPVDLGTIALLTLNDQAPADGALWYTFQVAADGAFTADLSGAGIGPSTVLALGVYNAEGLFQALAAGATHLGYTPVTAGTDYYLMASGLEGNVDLQLGNPLTLGAGGTQATFTGSPGSDTFQISHNSPFQVIYNGVAFSLPDTVTTLLVEGLGGGDQATILGTDADETALLLPGWGELSGGGYRVRVSGMESIIIDGGGGQDMAELVDSPGDDAFEARLGFAQLAGLGFSNQALSFEQVHGYGRSGGHDEASLFDTAGDDTLVASPGLARITGAGYYARAKLFDAVHAYALAGGFDTARLADSPGDDTFVATPTLARLFGGNFLLRAKFFDVVQAASTAGGVDQARLYDSPGNDVFTASPTLAALAGAGFRNRALGFDAVTALGTAGGKDVANLTDSPGDDTFTATPLEATLVGSGFQLKTQRFDRVTAKSVRGGHDVAHLFDSAGNDTFLAMPNLGKLSNTWFLNQARYFDEVHAYAKGGGNDTALLYDSVGNDQFVGRPEWAAFSGAGYFNRAKFFERVQAFSTVGADAAYLYDSALDDLLEAGPDWARLSSSGALKFSNEVSKFASVTATSTTGNDTKVVDPLATFLTLNGAW